jgi:hypothetical protein
MEEINGTSAKAVPTPPITVVAATRNRRLLGLTSSPLITSFLHSEKKCKPLNADEYPLKIFINYSRIY